MYSQTAQTFENECVLEWGENVHISVGVAGGKTQMKNENLIHLMTDAESEKGEMIEANLARYGLCS